ncbi:ATP-binding protein [Micromonospora sicca]|uniref:ATP-binding protein n=1 Tax=Micromonospora sicca TaxID=2202420 RepID=A0A317DCZ6_9ACTN|nr:ATP-binding protein [Micromonospora sp. 4G51]
MGVRLAVVREADEWQLRRADVVLDAPTPLMPRLWTYPQEAFIEQQVPGTVAASLLSGHPQEVAGYKVVAPKPAAPNATFERIAGQRRFGALVTAWPRTEWRISGEQTSVRQDGLLIGNGPSYLNYTAACSAFFDGAAPDHQGHGNLWRVIRHDRRAWLHRIKITPVSVVVGVQGDDLRGVRLELSSPTSSVSRPVGSTGRVTIRLSGGLGQHALLLLRTAEEWLDYRYFDSPIPGSVQDASVIFEQPGADLELLMAGGEGQYVEFKKTVTRQQEDKRSFLKTVAAFASWNSGTVLVGIDDDGQVVGVPADDRDKLQLLIASIIRDSIEPEPTYVVRWVEHDGRHVLLLEVQGRPRWHVLEPKRPEFYVRRGASTMPAKREQIGEGFGQNVTGNLGQVRV